MWSMSYTFAAAAAVLDIVLFRHCFVNVEANFDVLLLSIVHRRSTGGHRCRCDRSNATVSISIVCAVVLLIVVLMLLLLLLLLAVCCHWCKCCERWCRCIVSWCPQCTGNLMLVMANGSLCARASHLVSQARIQTELIQTDFDKWGIRCRHALIIFAHFLHLHATPQMDLFFHIFFSSSLFSVIIKACIASMHCKWKNIDSKNSLFARVSIISHYFVRIANTFSIKLQLLFCIRRVHKQTGEQNATKSKFWCLASAPTNLVLTTDSLNSLTAVMIFEIFMRISIGRTFDGTQPNMQLIRTSLRAHTSPANEEKEEIVFMKYLYFVFRRMYLGWMRLE